MWNDCLDTAQPSMRTGQDRTGQARASWKISGGTGRFGASGCLHETPTKILDSCVYINIIGSVSYPSSGQAVVTAYASKSSPLRRVGTTFYLCSTRCCVTCGIRFVNYGPFGCFDHAAGKRTSVFFQRHINTGGQLAACSECNLFLFSSPSSSRLSLPPSSEE